MENIENTENKEPAVAKAGPGEGGKAAPPAKRKMKTRTKVLILAAVVLVVAAVLVAIFVFGGPPQLAPGTNMVAGDTITVRVRADQIEDLYGYEFKLYFDVTQLEYKALRSSIEDITTIFQKPFEGYIRVGATKIGEAEGSNGQNLPMCEVELTVLQDGPLPEITMEEVNVVDSAQEYITGIEGWSFSVAKAEA